ncbi:MAG TPA: hypothetical protein VFV33_03075, partial [Gemmatimonadaceae bacterium]|nr:hypothetical protein [Gemmatimonadaceae bacterium]
DGTASAYTASEIVNQVQSVRQRGSAPGTILFRASLINLNRDNLFGAITADAFATPALAPAMAWVDAAAPAAPTIGAAVAGAATWQLTVASSSPDALRWWWVRWRTRSTANALTWRARLVPASAPSVAVPATPDGARTDAIVLHAVDRAGNLSPPTIWRAP